MHSDILALYTDLHMHEKFALKNIWWYTKWIWGWSNSFSFFDYLQTNNVQQMQMELVNWYQKYGQFKGYKIRGNKKIICFIWLYLKSVFEDSD